MHSIGLLSKGRFAHNRLKNILFLTALRARGEIEDFWAGILAEVNTKVK
jgi:hypothetical protein